MKSQLAKNIYLSQLGITKEILSLLEFKMGKNSEDYKYLRSQIFNDTYDNLKKLFKKLETEKLIAKCPKNCSIRNGYTECTCGGSGFINSEN